MEILLVQVPTSHMGAGERVYPIGLSRLAALIPEQYGKTSLDMNLHTDPWPLLLERLQSIRPEIVALSFRNIDPLAGHQASYISSLKSSAKMVRNLLPSTKIIAGGPAFSLFGIHLMKEIPDIDFGIVGEGESVFIKLLQKSFNPQSIPGLIWRKGGNIHSTHANQLMDLDCIPSLDTNSFCPVDYIEGNKYVASIGIEGKRGCDLSCSYCVYPCLGGYKMRLRNPQNIVDEIEILNKKFSIKLFHFTDSVVNRPPEHFEAICLELIRRKLEINWTGFFREDSLTEKIADFALKAGLNSIYFSADALTKEGLKILNKGISQEDILRAARITSKKNILTMCHFLINLPGETKRDAAKALEMLNRILDIHNPAGNLGAIIFNNIRLYPGAKITQKLIKSRLLDPNINLIYPVYYNPPESSYLKYKLEALAHGAGIFSRLKLGKKKFIKK